MQGGQFASLQKNGSSIGFFITEGFMNESGKLVKPLLSSSSLANFIIVHDYLDANLGVVKIKEGGSAEYEYY